MEARNPADLTVKLALLLVSALTVMAGATIAPTLPAMQAHFAEVPGAAIKVRMVLTLPALFIAGMAPIAGMIVDRIGRKSVLVVSTLIYGLAGAAGFLADTLEFLLISRALLGIAVGGLMTSVTVLIADYYEGQQRASFMGLQAGFMGISATLFLVVGGVLADIEWRVPFLIYFAAYLVLPLIVIALYEPRASEKCAEQPAPISGPGGCVAEAIRATGQKIPSAAQAPVQLMFFLYAVMIAVQIIFYLIPVQLPFFLQDLTGANASESGLALAAMTLFIALGSLQYARLSARFDHFQVLSYSFLMIGAGYLLISFASGLVMVIVGLVLAGAGLGFLTPNLNVWLANETPASLRGRVLGGFTTALFLGQFISPLVGQPISAQVGISGLYLAAGAMVLVLIPIARVTGRLVPTKALS
jgi:MFS family permease